MFDSKHIIANTLTIDFYHMIGLKKRVNTSKILWKFCPTDLIFHSTWCDFQIRKRQDFPSPQLLWLFCIWFVTFAEFHFKFRRADPREHHFRL